MEEFKGNMTTIENKLTQDNTDATADINVAISWIDYFLKATTPELENQRKYFFNESLGRMTRGLLKRKFPPNSKGQQELAINFLKTVLRVCFALFNQAVDLEGLLPTIGDVLDPNHNFYLKYGFPEVAGSDATATATAVASTSTSTSSSSALTAQQDHVKFLNELDVDSCVDFYTDDKRWEVCLILKMSEFRTELQIQNMTSEKMDWVSIDTHGHRLAPFDTKSSNPTQAPPEDPAVSMAAIFD